MFLAALLWSLNGALIKILNAEGQGLHGVTIACCRSIFAGLFLIPLAWGRFGTLWDGRLKIADCPEPPRLRGADPRGMNAAARGNRQSRISNGRRLRPGVVSSIVAFALMTTSFVVAITMTSAANAIILQYTSTLWVFFLSPWIVGERAPKEDFKFVGLALAGIAVIFAGGAGSDLPGLLVSLSAGFFYGLLVLLLRKIRDCDAAAVTVVNNLGTALLLLPFALWLSGERMSLRSLLILVLMGAFQLGLPYYFFSKGLARVPAHQAALITMIEPVLVPIWAYLAVGDQPSIWTVAGGGVILAALGLFIFARGRRARASSNVEWRIQNGE